MKKITLKMRRIKKTPEKSRMITGIRKPSLRGPHQHSPFATLCPQLRATRDQAVRPLSALTPSHLSGITQVMWEVLPLMKMMKKQHITVLCQVRANVQQFGLTWSSWRMSLCGKGGGLKSCSHIVFWFSSTIYRCEQTHLFDEGNVTV